MAGPSPRLRLLSGRYQIEEFLGRGGMAAVYRGTDRVLDRTVAVKILAAHLVRDAGFLQRFRREARSAAGLSHPNVVRIYDTGSDGNIHYIVMEHIDGRTLAHVLADGPPLPQERALEIGTAVASALTAAHGQGLIHRDVKPGNVLLASSGEIKVVDFGIARAVAADTLTRTATVLGTAAYLSPEQATGERVDPRSDLYSLGAVLYEMLAGRPPFIGDSSVAVAVKHVRDRPEPLSRIAPGVGPDLEAVVHRALAKDPDERYPSAEAMRADLERVRGGLPVDAVATATPGPHGPTRKTEPGSGTATELVPVDRTAELMPVGVPPTPAGASPPHRRSRRWPIALLAAAALVAIALVAAFLLPGLIDGGPATGPSTSPSTSTTPSSPSPSPAATVQEAAANLRQIVLEGEAAGEVSHRAVADIGGKTNTALRDYDRGDVDKALEDISKLQDAVDHLVDKGDITSTDRADAIRQAVSDLEAAMQASPTGEDEGD